MIRKIPKKATFGIIAPGFPSDPRKLTSGTANIKSYGHKLVYGSSIKKSHLYFAGSDQERANNINEMFESPEIDAILCTRGGWGSLRLLDKLDYHLIKKHPKLLIGYSDITSLQLALWKKCQVASLSGPMVAVEFADKINNFTEYHLWQQIYNSKAEYHFDFAQQNIEIWNEGVAEGYLLGGCLSMIVHQLGTPYSPDYTNSILFLEDIGEQPYKIDRQLSQLEKAGILNSLKGLIIGHFVDCNDDNPSRKKITSYRILEEFFKERTYPVIFNFPYGHINNLFSLPIGVSAKLDTIKKVLSMGNLFL